MSSLRLNQSKGDLESLIQEIQGVMHCSMLKSNGKVPLLAKLTMPSHAAESPINSRQHTSYERRMIYIFVIQIYIYIYVLARDALLIRLPLNFLHIQYEEK